MDIYNLILNGKIAEINLKTVSEDQRELIITVSDLLRGKRRKFQSDILLLKPTEPSVGHILVVETLQDIADKNYRNLIARGQKHQNYVLLQCLAGWAALKVKKYKEAGEFYRRAASLQPQNPRLAWALGEYYFVVKDYTNAIQCYQNSLSLGQDQWEFKWIIRYVKTWQTVAGSPYKATFFTLAWSVLSVLATQWIWLWLIPYLSLVSIHGIAIVASWRIGNFGKADLISLRAIVLTLSAVFIRSLWNG